MARRHDVHPAGPENSLLAKAVVVHHLALEQPRHRLQAHVRMGRHVHGRAPGERQRSESIEKTPRPDHAAAPHRQRARDAKRAESHFVVRVLVEAPLRRAERHE
jgi:hypothetical protein